MSIALSTPQVTATAALSKATAAFTPVNGTLLIASAFTLPGTGRELPTITDTCTNSGAGSTWTRIDRLSFTNTPNLYPAAEKKFYSTWACLVTGAQSGTVTTTVANACTLSLHIHNVSDPHSTSDVLDNVVRWSFHGDLGEFHLASDVPMQAFSDSTNYGLINGVCAATGSSTASGGVTETTDTNAASLGFPAGVFTGADISPNYLPGWSWSAASNHSIFSAFEFRKAGTTTPRPMDLWWHDDFGDDDGTGTTTAAITRQLGGTVYVAVSVQSTTAGSVRTATGLSGLCATWTKVATQMWGPTSSPLCELTWWRGSGAVTEGQTITLTVNNANLGTAGTILMQVVEVVEDSNVGVVQSDGNAQDATTAQTTTFTSGFASYSGTLVAFAQNAYGSGTGGIIDLPVGAGLDRWGPIVRTKGGRQHALTIAWTAAEMATPTCTATATADCGTLALEIAQVAPEAPPVETSPPIGNSIAASLNALAGTSKLDAQGAANAWAGTTNLDLLGALNAKAGVRGMGLNGVCNLLAGTTNLDAQGALANLAAQ